MPLLSLPNELLTLIVRDTLPESFESFMLTGKAIHVLGKSFISKHNEMKHKYGRFEYELTESSSIKLLHDIIHEPLMVRYFRYVDFGPKWIVLNDQLTPS